MDALDLVLRPCCSGTTVRVTCWPGRFPAPFPACRDCGQGIAANTPHPANSRQQPGPRRGGGPTAKSITRCTVTAGNGGCLVAGQAGNAFRHEPRLPAPHPPPAWPCRIAAFGRAAAIGRRQDDFGAPNMLLRRVAIADNRVKLTAIGVTFTTIPALMTRA